MFYFFIFWCFTGHQGEKSILEKENTNIKTAIRVLYINFNVFEKFLASSYTQTTYSLYLLSKISGKFYKEGNTC